MNNYFYHPPERLPTNAILEQGTITYTIEYENTGEGTATNVNIIEVLPEKTELSIVNSPQSTVSYWINNQWQPAFTPSATKLKWLIPSVSPAQSGSVSFAVKVK